jgi:hypothetical protein
MLECVISGKLKVIKKPEIYNLGPSIQAVMASFVERNV